jgi:hypothetical protein
MTRQNVAKWCRELEAGRTGKFMMRKGAGGRQSSLTAPFKKTEEKIRADSRLTMDELHEQRSVVSRTVLDESD